MRGDGTDVQEVSANAPATTATQVLPETALRLFFAVQGTANLISTAMNVRCPTNDLSDKIFPVFSPSANQIAFISNRDHSDST
jgi:hypothetical protein